MLVLLCPFLLTTTSPLCRGDDPHILMNICCYTRIAVTPFLCFAHTQILLLLFYKPFSVWWAFCTPSKLTMLKQKKLQNFLSIHCFTCSREVYATRLFSSSSDMVYLHWVVGLLIESDYSYREMWAKSWGQMEQVFTCYQCWLRGLCQVLWVKSGTAL